MHAALFMQECAATLQGQDLFRRLISSSIVLCGPCIALRVNKWNNISFQLVCCDDYTFAFCLAQSLSCIMRCNNVWVTCAAYYRAFSICRLGLWPYGSWALATGWDLVSCTAHQYTSQACISLGKTCKLKWTIPTIWDLTQLQVARLKVTIHCSHQPKIISFK